MAPGWLRVVVKPWAEVTVDGKVVGVTPFEALSLPSGPHRVRVRHPTFEAEERQVVIRPGDTTKVTVDLPNEGVRKTP